MAGESAREGCSNRAGCERPREGGCGWGCALKSWGSATRSGPIPFHLLPEVVREVGRDVEVHVDTGIMSGADVVASVALGARFTMVGRAYLYGLMAGGAAGVDRMFQIVTEQMTRTMRLLGVSSLEELEPRHVKQLQRLIPRT